MFLLNLILSSIPRFCRASYTSHVYPEGYEIEHATIFFKHGNRAPVDKFPKYSATDWNCYGPDWIAPGGDQFDEDIFFMHQFRLEPIPEETFLNSKCQAGHILENGTLQIRRLAEQLLYKAYPSLLPKDYKKRMINSRSTYQNRCIQSLQVLFHYLFHFSQKTIIDDFVANEELEDLVPNPIMCPSLGKVIDKVENISEFISQKEELMKELERLKKEDDLIAIPHWARLPELFSTYICEDKPLPPGFDYNITDQSFKLFENFFRLLFKDEDGKRYGTGILLYDIYLYIRDYLSGSTKAKFNFISGHTLTLMALQAAFDLDIRYPAFADYIAIELLKKDNERYVAIKQNGDNMKTYTLDEFFDYAKKMRPSEKECNISYPFVEKDKKDIRTTYLQMSFS